VSTTLATCHTSCGGGGECEMQEPISIAGRVVVVC
jgi:hypothetical protein